jgi:5'-nucleotidase
MTKWRLTMSGRIFIDMDGVLADFHTEFWYKYTDKQQFPQAAQGFFENLKPLPMAVESFNYLFDNYDVWVATAPSVKNPLCYTEKRLWVEKHLGMRAVEKMIIIPDKSLLVGDILIDDNLSGKGQDRFEGLLIHFDGDALGYLGTTGKPDWRVAVNKVKKHLHKG